MTSLSARAAIQSWHKPSLACEQRSEPRKKPSRPSRNRANRSRSARRKERTVEIDKVRNAAKMMREAMHMLDGGPLDYYLVEMAAAYDMLMSRFAPFKVGDQVQLAVTPVITEKDSWGWMPYRHILVEGAVGIVTYAECGSRGFRFGVTFPQEGGEFRFAESSLRAVA